MKFDAHRISIFKTLRIFDSNSGHLRLCTIMDLSETHHNRIDPKGFTRVFSRKSNIHIKFDKHRIFIYRNLRVFDRNSGYLKEESIGVKENIMATSTLPHTTVTEYTGSQWRSLCRVGGIAALLQLICVLTSLVVNITMGAEPTTA